MTFLDRDHDNSAVARYRNSSMNCEGAVMKDNPYILWDSVYIWSVEGRLMNEVAWRRFIFFEETVCVHD